ncbi:MAG: hypothetical protein HKN32_00085 [Flavobacteriales bacterium]|nr:hypothetical protein [Flavobacteriales bacterium]
MKYRRLTTQELETMRDDFVQFLAANGIGGDDWKKLKEQDGESASQLVDIFSDMVWDKVLTNIKFVEVRAEDELRVLSFGEKKIDMVLIKVEDKNFDFTNRDDINSVAEGNVDLMKFNPEVFRGTRDYTHGRKMEIFVMLEQGARPCKEVFWLSINKMIPPVEKNT